MLQAVLFDLDGTLLDTAADFTTVLNAMLADHRQPAQDYQEVRKRVSDGARAVVSLGFDCDQESENFSALLEEFLDRYLAQISSVQTAQNTSLFPGMAEALHHIESLGIQWGIVTNKPARFTEPLLLAMGLDQRCATAICPDHVKHKKPHPEPIYLACKQMACAPAQTIYVGDHRRDIDAGRHASMRTVGCAYGYISEGDDINDWGADYIIDQAIDLNKIINQLHKA
jgi:2-phosphoglycolate phosphatase